MIRFFIIAALALAWTDSGVSAAGQEKGAPEKFVLDLGGGVKMEFVWIKAGKFTMGDETCPDARPHEVTLSKDYWLQATETTQAQWQAVMGENPSNFKGADRPVDQVSWIDCRLFMQRLNEKAKADLKGWKAALPTEAEWEYACRAGSKGKWCFGDDKSKLGEYAWFNENSDNQPHPVGKKKPNAWGLYDMHGNLWEWCEDWYGEYPENAVKDPTGPEKGEMRVQRGGTWVGTDLHARSANRGSVPPARRLIQGLRTALRWK